MEQQERTARWAGWAADFLNARTLPMSEPVSRVFINLTMMEMTRATASTEVLAEFQQSFPFKVLDKRAEFVGLAMNDHAKMLLCVLSGNPGTLVMYAYALRYWQLKNEGAPIMVAQLAEIFPFGFLSEDALSKAWDAQKLDMGDRTINLLDTLSKDGLTLPV